MLRLMLSLTLQLKEEKRLEEKEWLPDLQLRLSREEMKNEKMRDQPSDINTMLSLSLPNS